jgi:hypothetical protein
MDRRRHETTSYANESIVGRLINNKLYRDLNEICSDVYEVTSVKGKVDHKEPIVLGLFILQYAKMRMLELVYNFFVKFCDRDLYQFIEMDTDSLYMSLGKEKIEDCIRSDKIGEWENFRQFDHRDNFRSHSKFNFFPRTCCPEHISHDKREPGLFKEEWRGDEMIALCSKTYCCICSKTCEENFSSKGLNKNFLDEPAAKYRRVMETKVNQNSTNRGFRCMNNSMVTYTLQKKGLAYFYPKRKVADDGVRTEPLDI